MFFGLRINIASAAMEGIYERLCWVYTTLHNTMMLDHKGEAHHFGYIYPIYREERFHIQSNSLRSQTMSRNLWFETSGWKTSFVQGQTRSTWEGIHPILRFVGMKMEMRSIFHWGRTVSLSHARSWISHKKGSELPNLSYVCWTQQLEPSNRVLGDILGRAFEALASPSTKVTSHGSES